MYSPNSTPAGPTHPIRTPSHGSDEWDLLGPALKAQQRLASGEDVAVELWAMGYRAGASAERARQQLAAADFGAYLGPAPVLHDLPFSEEAGL